MTLRVSGHSARSRVSCVFSRFSSLQPLKSLSASCRKKGCCKILPPFISATPEEQQVLCRYKQVRRCFFFFDSFPEITEQNTTTLNNYIHAALDTNYLRITSFLRLLQIKCLFQPFFFSVFIYAVVYSLVKRLHRTDSEARAVPRFFQNKDD